MPFVHLHTLTERSEIINSVEKKDLSVPPMISLRRGELCVDLLWSCLLLVQFGFLGYFLRRSIGSLLNSFASEAYTQTMFCSKSLVAKDAVVYRK